MSEWRYEPAKDLGLTPAERARSYRREGGLFSWAARCVWWTGASGLLRVWNRLRVEGREHLPSADSFVFVANHESHLDVFLLAAALPLRLRARFIPLSAEDVFFNKPTRTYFAAHVLNALPVRRTAGARHGFAAMRERLLSQPTIYAIFPAGKRARDTAMLPFKPGIGMLVAGTEIPVVPCHVEGCFEALRPETKLLRPAKLVARIGAPRTFRDEPDERAGWERIAAVLEEDVRKLGGEAVKERPS